MYLEQRGVSGSGNVGAQLMILIGAYSKVGLENAEKLKERARRRGAKPNAKTWEIFLDYYLKNGNFILAVDCVANAISVGRGDGQKWVPSSVIVSSLMGAL
jgi:hypothetical protein